LHRLSKLRKSEDHQITKFNRARALVELHQFKKNIFKTGEVSPLHRLSKLLKSEDHQLTKSQRVGARENFVSLKKYIFKTGEVSPLAQAFKTSQVGESSTYEVSKGRSESRTSSVKKIYL